MRQSIFTGLAAGFLVLTSAACAIDVQGAGVVTRDEKRFTVSGAPQLNLRTFDGAIQVRAWDQKDVRVEIQRRGPDAQAAAALVVNVTQDGDRIAIEALDPRRHDGGPLFGFWSSGSVSLIVTTPRNVALEARTGDGAITTEGLAGSLVLNTGDGSIDVKGIEGRVKAHSGDGSIRIDDAVGSVDADTGDGAIDLAGRLEEVSLKSGDGSIRVHVAPGSTLAGDWNITTGDGAIDLRVPDTLNAEIDAHTGDGNVRGDGVVSSIGDDRRNRHDLRGRLGTGGRVLRVRSGDGSILISR
jgi:DUF4097 and DUF4098 domain-containing protein YvlB